MLQRQSIISAQKNKGLTFFYEFRFIWEAGDTKLGGAGRTLAPSDLLAQAAAPGTGSIVAWQQRNLLTRRCWEEEVETLIIVGRDTELWLREAEWLCSCWQECIWQGW